MLFKRDGYPEESELVLCTVTKVQYHSVFCNLDEYGKSGMIHISEVSPGRIRNIRDYVKEGKKVVCAILKIDEEKGHIDLSLRRVNDSQRRRKMDEIKQEQKAEKIVEMYATEIKKPFEKVYADLSKKIRTEYDLLHLAFNEVVEHDLDLTTVGLDKKESEKLTEIIKDKIKPKQVMISGDLMLKSFAENGLEVIKKALIEAEKVDDEIDIAYEGGGKYLIKVVAKEYKSAESHLKKALDIIIKQMEDNDGVATFERREK